MKRTISGDELIQEITEVLRQGDGEFIEDIANRVLVTQVTYLEDGFFTQEVEDEDA